MPGHRGETRILIVEDEQVVADTLGKILSANGYEIRVAYSAEAALEIITGWSPRVAILDVMLPRMNGIAFAVILRQRLPECDVILFSGQPSVEALLKEACEEGHQFEVLAKPVHPNVILHRISDLTCPGGAEACSQNS